MKNISGQLVYISMRTFSDGFHHTLFENGCCGNLFTPKHSRCEGCLVAFVMFFRKSRESSVVANVSRFLRLSTFRAKTHCVFLDLFLLFFSYSF